MADENLAEPGQTDGQPAEGSETTTQPGPEGIEGQSVDTGTTDDGHQESETVFDPAEYDRLTKDLPPELQSQAAALRTNLQGAYTKKFQGISENRKKIEAFDAFNSDPVSSIQKYAKQLGYNLTRGEAEAVQQDQNQSWEPKNWDEVMQRAEQNVLAKLQPMLSEVQNIKKTSIEKQLTEIDPTWQQYEDKMMTNINQHPTLASDPALLYRMSVPKEVSESRAVQTALKKMQAKVDGGKISGGSTTNKSPTTGLPDKPISFQDAVKAAQKKLADEGLRPN